MRRAAIASFILNALFVAGLVAMFCSGSNLRERLSSARQELAISQDRVEELGRLLESERASIELERGELVEERARLDGERARLADERGSYSRASELVDDCLGILEASRRGSGETGSGK